MTKEILANRGRMNDDLRMSEGELSSLISSSGDDDHSCRRHHQEGHRAR